MISPSLTTKGCVKTSNGLPIGKLSVVKSVAGKYILNKVDTVLAAVALSVSVKVKVTNTLLVCALYNLIDLIKDVVDGIAGTTVSSVVGTVYKVVALVLAKTKDLDKNISANEPVPC